MCCADDGSDPTPLPSFPGQADSSFTQFSDMLGPCLGSNPRPGPTSDPKDPPLNSVATVMDEEANLGSAGTADGADGSDEG